MRERRAFRARVGGADAVIAAEDAGLYRDAFGVMPPGGLPEAFLEPVDDAVERVLLRYARSHGPFTTRDVVSRYGLETDAAETLLAGLETRDLLIRGELRPGGVEREWCDPDVLRRIRRASLAVLRRQVEPAEQATLARFLPGWHGIDRRATLREALVPLQALALPVSLWETEILRGACPATSLPRSISCAPRARSSGSARGSIASLSTTARTRLSSVRRRASEPLEGPVHDAIRAVLNRSAEFWLDLVAATGPRVGRGAAGALGARLERRDHQRRVGAAAREAPLRRPVGRAAAAPLLADPRRRRGRDRGPLVAGVAPLRRRRRSHRSRPTAARSPSSCSNGRESSPATGSAPRESPEATARSTAS